MPNDKSRRLMMIEISFPFLEMFIKGELNLEEYKKHYSNLPKDTKIIRVCDTNQYMPDYHMTSITLILESKEFEELPLGARIPHFNFQFIKTTKEG